MLNRGYDDEEDNDTDQIHWFWKVASLIILAAALYIGYDQYKMHQAQVAMDKIQMSLISGMSPNLVNRLYDQGITLQTIQKGMNNGR